jgi:imidazolonepropionase
MRSKIINIRSLLNTRSENRLLRGKELAQLPFINNAYLIIQDGIIAAYGEMENDPEGEFDEITDASGQMILPCWCDSHTHLVFAASREEEFVDKIKGLTYAEIAAKGGGILK